MLKVTLVPLEYFVFFWINVKVPDVDLCAGEPAVMSGDLKRIMRRIIRHG